MKAVLVLGAGFVARPLVRYMLEIENFRVRVASRTGSKAEKLIGDHPRGKAQQLDVTNRSKLRELVQDADLVVSLLPYTYHVEVAKLCLEYKKHLVTTSYVSDEMRALDKHAKEAGVLFLNELGLDPGIDHMSAMKVIHRVQNKGGKITSFKSYCGGLPAPEANTNPLGYKLSWNPRGVVLAAKNSARYLEGGQEIAIPGEQLFENCSIITLEGLGDFEAYPNRDSLGYIEKYGISTTETMFRGTLRNQGWCQTWKKFVELGLLDEKKLDLSSLTFKEFIARLIKSQGDIKKDLAAHLKIDVSSEVIKKIEWLGLLNEESIPLQQGSALDILTAKLVEKLQYEPGERDMIILHHEFIADYPVERRKEKISSTLINFGIPGGDTAMARTVGLPAAIGSKLILEGKLKLAGVHIPVLPIIYEPILQELERQKIAFSEKSEELEY